MNDQQQKKAENTFRVQDKRSLNKNGSLRQELKEEKENQPAKSSKKEKASPPTKEQTPNKIEFSTLISILTTPALIFMGAVKNPENNQLEINLPLAEQHIELLQLLQKKTKGNLDKEEAEFIERALFELKMLFVQASNKKKETKKDE